MVREVWSGLEASGEAATWVDGVGRGGDVEGNND